MAKRLYQEAVIPKAATVASHLHPTSFRSSHHGSGMKGERHCVVFSNPHCVKTESTKMFQTNQKHSWPFGVFHVAGLKTAASKFYIMPD